MNKRIIFLSVLIYSIIASAFYSNVNSSYARDSEESLKASSYEYYDKTLTVYQNFTMLETAENKGTMTNISSIDINLGTSRWNATNIEFNITDIDFENETKTVIDFEQLDPSHTLDKNFPMLGAQFKIDVPTILYGVDIYGFNSSLQPTDMYFHVFGSDPVGAPDENTEYGNPILLNMSKAAGIGWHRQTFSTPIDLSNGYYYFVMNGTSIALTPPTQMSYQWYYKSYDANNPNLNSSRYSRTLGWSSDYRSPGQPFTYRLIRQINTTFYPSEIDLTAEINGIDHSIIDGNEAGKGNLSVSLDQYFPNTSILNIPVKNNISNALYFNISYYIRLNNTLTSGGSILIKKNIDNLWTVDPTLDRFGYNYSIKYKYPDNWKYVSVFNGTNNITDSLDVNINGNSVYILNNTINPNTDLNIIANSTNLDVELRVPLTTFKVGENLEFFVHDPAKLGNYTFILLNTIGSKQAEKLVVVTSSNEFPLNHTILPSAISGEWTALVFWNNETDAGVQTQKFEITGGGGVTTLLPPSGDDDDSKTTTEVDYSLVIIAVIITGLVIAGGFASLTAYKKVMKSRELKKERLYNKFLDAFNLNYVIVINKKSALNVYEQFFAGKKLDATLISGFLDAIRAFGIELTSSYEQSQSISLEYKDSKILMSEFKDFRLIFILKDRPSEEFLKSVTALSYDIDREYGELLEKFAGNLEPFAGIKGLIERHLNTSFISPLKIVDIEGIELSAAEISLIQKTKSIMKQNKLDYFFTTFLMPEQAYDPKRTQLIFDLIEKKVFQPTDI